LIHFYKRQNSLAMLKLFSFAVLLGSLSAAHTIVKKSGKIASAHSGPPFPLWHLEPLYVKALPAKTEEKRETAGESQSQLEESHSVLTDIDGQRNAVQQKIQKVSKNGKLISKVFQQGNANAGGVGEAPHFQKLTQIDLPELDIHQQFFDDGEEAGATGARVNHVKRNAGGSAPVRLPSPEEIAEYILLTGDQASVVNLIEGLVNNGKMSEEQALVYVETIKAMLESVEKEEEDEIREMLIQRKLEEAEREDALRNLLRRAPQDKEDNLYRQLRGEW